jgi:uncharacterized protein YdbL (DUF1318 family)
MKPRTSFAALVLAAVSLAFASLALAVDNGGPIDRALSAGVVGEQADGYLGFVKAPSPADAELQRLLNDVNIRRRAVYTDLAEKNRQPLEVVAALTAEQLVGRLPSGQFFRDGQGVWRRKP